MFFRRRLHRLPKFPPQVIPIFRSLCTAIASKDIPELRREFDTMWEKKLQEMSDNPGFDQRTAVELRKACLALMDGYDMLPLANQKLAIGAIRYCVATEDAFSDEIFASGQHDDVKVMNYVLEETGMHDYFVDR